MLLAAAEAPFTDKELALGKVLAGELERVYPPSPEAEAQAYVARVGARLAAAVGSGPWVFRVLENRSLLAADLPGGRVYVSTGILAAARNEAGLAAVLAHLMAHVAARHGGGKGDHPPPVVRPRAPLVFAGGPTGVCELWTDPTTLPVSAREKRAEWERQADRTGREYLRRAGYDAAAMSDMLGRLRERRPGPE